MSFWNDMPKGMLLRSPYVASNIHDPHGSLSLDAYSASIGRKVPKPVPLDEFVRYGRWVGEQLGSSRDQRMVANVERENGHFAVTLGDGERVRAKRVVVAAGIERFARRPEPFRDLPRELVSHTSDHNDLAPFAGRRVTVIGGGQSALESAALLNESGAHVEVLVRAPLVRFLARPGSKRHNTKFVSKLLYAPPDVGPAGVSQVVAHPDWYRRMPRTWQDRLAPRSIRPAGAAWLIDRLEGLPLRTGLAVQEARAANGGGVELSLSDGTTTSADHVMLGTGYQVDINGYPFMAPGLLRQIAQVNGYPRLTPGFETTVPNLFIVGAPGAWSFGPLMRFVAGAEFAAPALMRGIRARSLQG
jgi:hypothetical protein